MKQKKLSASLSSMKLAKIVRKFAGLNSWKMYKRLKRKSVQSYLSFERTAKRLTLSEYFTLEAIYIEAGGTVEDFNRLARECAAKEKS